jgi:hypothetical protein
MKGNMMGPRQKVELVVEFECDFDEDLDSTLAELCRVVEDDLPSATNCFSDVIGVEAV